MGSMGYPSNTYKNAATLISDRAIDEARPLKVIYIGAGVSGILAGIQFPKYVPSIDLVIYEKNPEIGGTWYENRYPGCACDIPSHSYQLSFESSTEWTQFYSGASEILDYWRKVVEKYDIRKRLRLSHKCLEAHWDESRSKWIVKFLRLDLEQPVIVTDEADVFVTGTGLLNQWKWPNIDGIREFKGELLHTANWNDSFDPTDKRVAVIGAGSSGIQVVPAIVSKVKAMDHYVRGKTWIASQFGENILKARKSAEGLSNFEYTAEEREEWRKNPESYLAYRKSLERGLQGMYSISQRESLKNVTARANFEKNMRSHLSTRPDIMEQLIPDFPPLCKRLTPGPGYLEALIQPHVDTVFSHIAKIEADGIITRDGVKRPVDAIICATGFETSPSYGFPIYGRDGVNLRVKYEQRPKTYMSVCTDNFPNFFQSLGPNSFQGAGSLLIMMEYVHTYMAKILRKMAYDNVKTIEPKRKQVENFYNYCEEYFKSTVYTADCVSWYKGAPLPGGKGPRVAALWPGSSIHALHAFERVRWEDYEMEYCDDNDFGWFGNGWTMGEREDSQENIEPLTWYLNGTKFLDDPLVTTDTTNDKQHEIEQQIQELVTPDGAI